MRPICQYKLLNRIEFLDAKFHCDLTDMRENMKDIEIQRLSNSLDSDHVTSRSQAICKIFDDENQWDIFVSHFNFNPLAKGNAYAYKPQRSCEIVMYHVGIEHTMFRLRQQHQLLPAVWHVHSTSTPHRLSQKIQFQWQGRGGTGRPPTCLKWIGVNFEVSPGCGDIHNCCFNFYALKRVDGYNPKLAKNLSGTMWGLNSQCSDWGNIASCQLQMLS